MQEIRQDIFPVCSFGRAENVFYQSMDSLCPQDLNLSTILNLIAGHTEPVFPSHILDRDDWQELLTQVITSGVKPRVQVALGREWEELSVRVLVAAQQGWGVDVLIDRPLTKLVTPAELSEIQDWRWIACPLRFFDTKQLLLSLQNHHAKKEIFLSFLEPQSSNTLLLNPDEVILTKKWLADIPSATGAPPVSLLLMTSSLARKSGFYQNPTLENYQSDFVKLGNYKKTRTLVARTLKNFPQFFSLLLYLGAFLFSEGPRPKLVKLPPIPYWKLGKIKWIAYAIFSRAKWALGQVGWTLRSYLIRSYWALHRLMNLLKRFLISSYWLFYKVVGFLRIGLIKTYWFFYFAFSQVRGRASQLFWGLRSTLSQFYWWLRPAANSLLRILLWPALKMYWFVSFQYNKRLHPKIKRLFIGD